MSNPLVIIVEVPRDVEGMTLETGSIEEQSRCVFEQMHARIQAVGGALDDIALVQIYLVNMADWAGMDGVWAEFFGDSVLPQRATVGVKELALKGMLIEIVVTAYLER